MSKRLFDYDPDLFMEDWIQSGRIKPRRFFEDECSNNNSDDMRDTDCDLHNKQG